MTLALALLAAQAAAIPPQPAAAPTDWSTLPRLPWRRTPNPAASDLSGFVADEVNSGRCIATAPVVVQMVVLVRADGRVLSVVPRAIDCPTVEQFAAGLVTSMARGNLRRAREGWYRTSLTFSWTP